MVGKDTFLIMWCSWCSRSKGTKKYLSDHHAMFEVEGYEKIPFWHLRGRMVGKDTFIIVWCSRSKGTKSYLSDHHVMFSRSKGRSKRYLSDHHVMFEGRIYLSNHRGCSRSNDTKRYLSDHHVSSSSKGRKRYLSDHRVMLEVDHGYEWSEKIPFWSSCDVRGRRVGKDTFLIIMWCSRSKGRQIYPSDHHVMFEVEW